MPDSSLAPDASAPIVFSSDVHRCLGVCWLRVWPAERLALVTDLGSANPGPSVTNAIEAVAASVETALGVVLGTGEVGWQLAEHYEGGLVHGPSIDFVRFRSRHGAVPMSPDWAPLQREELPWLWEAVSAPLGVTAINIELVAARRAAQARRRR